jgi:hypothetical protein
VIAKEVAHRVLHTMTHSITHSLSRSLPRIVATSVEKKLTHNLVNYYYCIYCYEKGKKSENSYFLFLIHNYN